MKKKILLLMCGVIFCRDLYAASVDDISDEGTPLIPPKSMPGFVINDTCLNAIKGYLSIKSIDNPDPVITRAKDYFTANPDELSKLRQLARTMPGFVIDNNCLKAIKGYLSIKPGDKRYPVITWAKDYFTANPGELSELRRLARNSCWWFNVSKPMTQIVLFSIDVNLAIMNSNITDIRRSILALQNTLKAVSEKVSAIETSGEAKPNSERGGRLSLSTNSQNLLTTALDQKNEISKLREELAAKDRLIESLTSEMQKTISDLQSKRQEQEEKRRSLEERVLKLEGQVQIQQAPSVEIPENLTRDLRSIQETVDRLERQLGEKVDTGRFETLRNSYGCFVTIVKALVDQADEGRLNTKIEELKKQKKDK